MGPLLVVLVGAVLELLDTSQTLRGDEPDRATFYRTPTGYVEGAGRRFVHSEYVQELERAVEESEHKQEFDPAARGITRQSVEGAHDELLRNVQRAAGKTLSTRIDSHLGFEKVAALAKRYVDEGIDPSIPSGHVEVSLSNELSVSNAHDGAPRLPWHVTFHDRSWQTYSPRVSYAVGALLAITTPNRVLVPHEPFWPRAFWADRKVGEWIWADFVREETDSWVRRLAGYDAAVQRYEVSAAALNHRSRLWIAFGDRNCHR